MFQNGVEGAKKGYPLDGEKMFWRGEPGAWVGKHLLIPVEKRQAGSWSAQQLSASLRAIVSDQTPSTQAWVGFINFQRLSEVKLLDLFILLPLDQKVKKILNNELIFTKASQIETT